MKTRCTLAAVLAGALTLPLDAQKAPPDLTNASLEELMNIEVYSVAKKPQRMGATAASVYVISADDIRRSGMRSVPELLRLAPGVQVAHTQSGGWAISIRGFADEFANKLLVLVDGRSVYDELYGGTFWHLQDMLVDDIERIEVIRGPGAAMWGINAVNGVINIVTKEARETEGHLVKFAAGSETEVNGAARSGGNLGSDAAYRVTAYYAGHGPFASADARQPASRYGWDARRVDFRLDWSPTPQDAVQVTGSGGLSRSGHRFVFPTPGNLYPAPRDQRDSSDSETLQVRWEHRFSDESSITVRAAWTATDNELETVHPHAVIGEFEFLHNLTYSRNALTWGLNYRDVSHSVPAVPEVMVTPAGTSQDTYAGFVADEFELLRDNLFVLAGVHVSDNQFTGIEVQPTARLLWTPSKRFTGWAAVSRAVRTPTLFERNFSAYVRTMPAQPLPVLVHYASNSGFRSEPMISYEAGQRFDLNKRLSVDLSGFMSFYQGLATNVPVQTRLVPPTANAPGYVEQLTTFANARYGQSRGAEGSVTWRATSRWKLAGGYSWLRVTTGAYAGQDPALPGYRINQTPHHQFQIRSYHDLTRTLELDSALYYVSSFVDGPQMDIPIPRHVRADVRLGWRPNHALEISAGVQNAFDPSHPEMISSGLQQLLEVPRNVYGSVTWKF